jgi:hypothetical protein
MSILLEGDNSVENSKGTEKGKIVFRTGLFDDLSVQDAFTIIALYGARLDPEDCQEDVSKITVFLNDYPIFNEKSSDTLTRINKFVNAMEQVRSLDAVKTAAKVLTPELRRKAFMLASEIGMSLKESNIETVEILKKLASKLSIDAKIVNQTINSIIKNFIDEIKDAGIFAIAHESEQKQAIITKWAQDISDRYLSVLKKHPAKIRNIVELPVSKEEVKIAIKISLISHVMRKSDEMVEILKDRYISIGEFQDIDPDDKEIIIEEVSNIDQQLESAYESVFPNYHKYMEVIISEQNTLLEDVNNFINDLKELKKES